MKKTMKALLACGLAAACISAPLFANGAKDGSSSTPLIPIEVWTTMSVSEAGPPPSDWIAYKLIREKLGIELKLTALPSNINDQDSKVNVAGAANNLPDLVQVSRESWTQLHKAGLIAPVDEMYAMMPNRTKLIYDADAINHTTIDGKSWGLASSGAIAKNEGVCIRKDWLDKLGLKVPVTLDDYFEVLKAFTEKDPDGNGKADTWGYGAFIEQTVYEDGLGRRFEPFMGAFGIGGTWSLKKNNPGLNVHNPAYFEGLSFIKKIIDAKLIDPNWVAYKKDDFRAAWKQGKFGMMREQNAALAAEQNYAPFDKNFPNGEWIIIDPPVGPRGEKAVGVYNQSYRIFAVSEKAAKAGKMPAIAKLLEWMSSDEGYYLLIWGEKGVNYVLDANGYPTVQGLPNAELGYGKPAVQPLLQLKHFVYYNSDMELVSRYPTYKTATSGKTMSSLKVLRDMQSRSWIACVGGDTLPTPNGDLRRFYNQGLLEFMTGKREFNAESWKTWLADFDALGGAAWEKAGIEKAAASGLLK